MVRFERGSHSDFFVSAAPNCSLSNKGRRRFCAAVGLVSLSIATGFAFAGAWLVLPFAGIEVALVTVVMCLVGRASENYEKISVHDGRLEVERCKDKQITRNEFQCYWAQLIMQKAAHDDCRLFVRSHGRQVEVGHYMDTEQRIELARELKIQLSRR